MFDSPKLINTLTQFSNTPTPVDNMTCSQILASDPAKIAFAQEFDAGRGHVGLLGGRNCWKEIVDELTEADQYLREKLTKLELEGNDMHSLSLPTLQEYTDMVAMLPDYTDGMLVFTKWEWNAKDVVADSEVGMCISQGENALASCWGLIRQEDGYGPNQSYQINLNKMPIDSRLNDYPDIGRNVTAGFNGSWLCSPVLNTSLDDADWNSVACLRFLPKLEKATINDPRFSKGAMRVTTFYEGQGVEQNAPMVESLSEKLLNSGQSLFASGQQ